MWAWLVISLSSPVPPVKRRSAIDRDLKSCSCPEATVCSYLGRRGKNVSFWQKLSPSCRISWWKRLSCSKISSGKTSIPQTGSSWTWCRTSKCPVAGTHRHGQVQAAFNTTLCCCLGTAFRGGQGCFSVFFSPCKCRHKTSVVAIW